MNLIEILRTLRVFWPGLKGCSSFSLLTLHKLPRPGFRNMRVITWHLDEQELAEYMLTHIDRMAVKGQIDLKVATKLVGDELGRLITLQVNEKGTGNPTVADLQKTITMAGGRLSRIPPAGPSETEGGVA